ncbi:MAG: arsenate reductase ArsC [Candidatus Thermoplasmatota archaeon]
MENQKKNNNSQKQSILFLCNNNSCRSQMAEALLNHIYSDRYNAFSAGVEPTSINHYAIEFMKEIGIDMTNHYSKSIEKFKEKNFDCVVTVCNKAKENCPFSPGEKIVHKSFEDPATVEGDVEHILKVFRKTRDKIKQWIIDFF